MSIGLVVICHNRPKYLKQCLESLNKFEWGGANEILIVEDNCQDEEIIEKNCEVIKPYLLCKNVSTIKTIENVGVAVVKNIGLSYMMHRDCDHIFLMEDDITMIHPNVCHYYMRTAKMYGIQHLNFALHGEMNKDKGFLYEGMKCYPNCVGAFSYYTLEVLREVGLMDEKFVNAWEHVEHTYRIIKAGYHPPFWNFADCPINHKLLKEIPESINNSSIRPRSDWKLNIMRGKKHWIAKHGEWLPPRSPLGSN